MSNTGKKIYNTLTQIYTDTGLPTGETKDNDPSDPDYIPPVEDPDSCPPPDLPPPVVSKIRIDIKNSSKQSIGLSSVIIKAQSESDSNAYYSNSFLGLLPGQLVSSEIKDQQDNFDRVKFVATSLALGIRLKMTVSYKKGSEVVYTVLREININQGDIIDEQTIEADKENGSTNLFRIEFTNDPIIVSINEVPIVDVGPDKVISLDEVSLVLAGTAVDNDGTITGTLWSQVSGPNTTTIVSPTSLTTPISGYIPGVYVFKLTATDNLSATGFDTIQVTVESVPNPNGTVNMFVDPVMADDTFTIERVTLHPYDGSADITLLTSPIDNSSGVVIKTPLKGTYKMSVQVAGVMANNLSLRVAWALGTQIRTINLPEAETYTFENVVVDEGIQGVLVSFLSYVQLSPSNIICYAQLTTASPILTSTNILPNGLIEEYNRDIQVKFYSDKDATTPINFTGRYDVQREETNVLASTVVDTEEHADINNVDTQILATLQESKVYDYDQIIPLIDHRQYVYTALNGEGYLIIP